jgi:hypothetical protein
MDPILGVALVLGIAGLAVWAAGKWRGPVSPDGESSDPGWWDPLPGGGWSDGGN